MGVDSTASVDQIRAAYRAAARQAHPDRLATSTTDGTHPTMVEINEAYRVLGHPGRRASYDAGLRSGERSHLGGETSPVAAEPAPSPVRPGWLARLLSPPGPARYPVRLILIAAVVSSVAMLVFSSLPEREPAGGVDGLIEVGSCVTLDRLEQAGEVRCSGTDSDLIVVALVPLDQTCADGRSGYIDRSGLAVICIENSTTAP